MADASHNELVAQFSSVTGTDADRAKFYLEAAGWDLNVAMASFYDEDDGYTDEASAPPAAAVPAPAAPQAPPKSSQPPPRKPAPSRFATIGSLQREQASDSDEDKGQEYYAGGSEHSGELIVGPPRKKKNPNELIDSMFKSAKDHGAEVLEPGASDGPARQTSVFRGAGYRLGDESEGSSHLVAGAPVKEDVKQVDVTLKLWKKGFSVDDGPLRDYGDPANKGFLDSIHKGEVPLELIRLAKGGEVNLNMEDHREEDYVKPKAVTKPFGGTGHTLGSPVPAVSSPPPSAAQSKSFEAAAKTCVSVDESQPTTSLQIRLADGSRMVSKFNNSHTVADVRNYIITARPQYGSTNFVLMTTFPNKELTAENETLEQANLLNAMLVQRLK